MGTKNVARSFPFLPYQLCTLFKLEYISGLTSGETGANAPVA